MLLVSPSTTQSEFFDSVIERQGKQPKNSNVGMSAKLVAQKTIRAIEQGNHEIILSWGGKSIVWLDRLFPTLANWVVAKYGVEKYPCCFSVTHKIFS